MEFLAIRRADPEST
jgi:hypothetical protein